MSQNASWCKTCLTTTFMIMINGLVLVHVCAEKEVPQKYGSTQVVLRHQKRLPPDLNNYNSYEISGNGKSKPVKHWQCRLKNLEPVLITLKNVVDRYDEEKNELKAIFSGVAVGDFRRLRKRKRLKDFNCTKFKNHKFLRKRIYKLLIKFHRDVKAFEERFQELIKYEQSPRFKAKDRSNGKRLKILRELQMDLKKLDVEIGDAIAMRKNKRLNYYRQPKSLGLAILSPPKSQTDLMIIEWETIQNSKEFLRDWRRRLDKKCWKCWKKLELGQP